MTCTLLLARITKLLDFSTNSEEEEDIATMKETH